MRPDTQAVHLGRPPHEPDEPLNTPITMASTYNAGGDVEYGRYGNPTWTAFEEALGGLEGGRCLAFASGLAAVATILDLVANGQKVVAPRHAYLGSIMQLGDLELRERITPVLVDITDTAAVVAACDDASLVWLESPTNPAMEVADIPAISEAAHAAGAYVVVDNTFATPILQQPLDLGADLVVHSVTKYISGHADALMGALVTRDDELYGVLKGRRDMYGAIPGTLEAWLALRGLRTLPLRMERAQANAQEPRTPPQRPRRRLRGPLSGPRSDRRDRPAQRRHRRPRAARHRALGLRHLARWRRVDPRTASSVEVRAGHDPGGPDPALGGDRGRRGPLGGPQRGARLRSRLSAPGRGKSCRTGLTLDNANSPACATGTGAPAG